METKKMPDETKPATRVSSVLNKAVTKQFILDAAKKLKPAWNCTRVAGEALDFYETHLETLIRGVPMVDLDLAPFGEPPEGSTLLVRSTVKHRVIEMARRKLTWVKFVLKIDDRVLYYIEAKLRARIKADVQSHPSIGQTFKP
jgi:hypothetical protein